MNYTFESFSIKTLHDLPLPKIIEVEYRSNTNHFTAMTNIINARLMLKKWNGISIKPLDNITEMYSENPSRLLSEVDKMTSVTKKAIAFLNEKVKEAPHYFKGSDIDCVLEGLIEDAMKLPSLYNIQYKIEPIV